MITHYPEKCIGCNSCIRVCPIHGANVADVKPDGTIGVNIDSEACINCGSCVKACEHNARGFEDDTDRFFNDMNNGADIAVIVAPAIKIAFDGYWRHLLSWFRSQGINHIYDVGLGADICTWAHLKYLKQNPNKKIISQPCAAIVNYVEKHNPELIPHLSPIQSPMLCTAIFLRKKLGRDIKIAALSPCVAKKDEFVATGIIEYNVTFSKVQEYIKDSRINLPAISVGQANFSTFEFDYMQGMIGSTYPRPGGLKDNLKLHSPYLDVINSEGSSIYRNLDKYLSEDHDNLPAVFDVLSCAHGCNSGPATGTKYTVFHMESIMHNVDKYNLKHHMTGNESIKSLFRKFDRELKLSDFLREYENKHHHQYNPTGREVDAIFVALGKFTKLEREYNCHACGYRSCRELAVGIARGTNTKESCIRYNHVVAQKNTEKINKILVEFENIAMDLTGVVDELKLDVTNVKSDAAHINSIGDKCSIDMNEITSNISELTELAVNIQDAMGQINNSIIGYKNMTSSVDDIASQINLLAVNANIEAVRAGSVGKGFSVIATEIRKLALHSQESVEEAVDCNKQINNAIDNISEIIRVINETILLLSDSVTKMRKDVTESTKHGKSINDAMGGVENVTLRISGLVDKTSNMK